jgi:hypothetical protein
MARYSIYVRPDLLQLFWAGMQAGDFITDAVLPINTSRRTGRRVLAEAGGVRPRRGRDLKGRCLTFAQREEIAIRRALGQSLRQIGAVIDRSASTVSRELRRNSVSGLPYRATAAHSLAYERASRPKPAKLHTNTALRAKVEEDLKKKYAPEQIAGRLQVEFPDEPEMRVSPETIYQRQRSVPRSTQPRSGRVFVHRTCTQTALQEDRPAEEPDPGDDQHLRTSSRGSGPCSARALGG